jgi:hypothetical protein
MPDRHLPCGCAMEWIEEETTVVFCSRHTFDYFDWDGTDRDFVKMIATPGKTGAEKKTESHSLRCGKIMERKIYTP